jgi:hypothetical protein
MFLMSHLRAPRLLLAGFVMLWTREDHRRVGLIDPTNL